MAYSEAERGEILAKVFGGMCGGKTVKEMASEVGVSAATLRQWVVWGGAEVEAQYRKARLMQGQALAEEAVEVARNTTNANAVAARLLVETLRWKAGKANPAEYGDKQIVESTGTRTVEIKIVEEDVSHRLKTPEAKQLAAKAVGVEVAEAVIEDWPAPVEAAPVKATYKSLAPEVDETMELGD